MQYWGKPFPCNISSQNVTSFSKPCMQAGVYSMNVSFSSFQGHEEDCPLKATNQPLLCSGGAVRHLHDQHLLTWCPCALWTGLCSHALLLPDCVLLDGSRSHPVAQEVSDCVQTGYKELPLHRHGNMLG